MRNTYYLDNLIDVIMVTFMAVVTAMLLVLLVALIARPFGGAAEREAFMESCVKHEPDYRCAAMWRCGNHTTK